MAFAVFSFLFCRSWYIPSVLNLTYEVESAPLKNIVSSSSRVAILYSFNEHVISLSVVFIQSIQKALGVYQTRNIYDESWVHRLLLET